MACSGRCFTNPQCGGYVRKHGKLSEERRERVAAQQMAAAIAAVSAPSGDPVPAPAPVPTPAAPSGLGSSLGNSGLSLPGLGLPAHPHLPLFVSPASAPPPPLPSLAALQPQQPSNGEAAAAMSDVGGLAGGLHDSLSPPDLPAQQAQQAEQQGEAMEVDGGAEPAADPPADAMQVDGGEQAAPQPSAEAEAAAAAAALTAAVFAPWQAELNVLREQRQAVAALVRAAFAPHLPQQEAEQAVKQEPVEVKQQPVDVLLPCLNLQLPAPQLPATVSLEPPAAACALRRSATASAAVAAAAAAAPARSASGSLRRAAAANHAAAAPQVGCGDSCLNRISFIHCDRATCPCGDRCTNRPFVELASPTMEVFLTPDKGWGVRAAAFIPRGSFIVEYAGEVSGGAGLGRLLGDWKGRQTAAVLSFACLVWGCISIAEDFNERLPTALPFTALSPPVPARHQVIDDKECARRAEEAKARSEPHFYMMEMAPGELGEQCVCDLVGLAGQAGALCAREWVDVGSRCA